MMRKTVPVLCFILLFAATLFSFSGRLSIQPETDNAVGFRVEETVCGNG